MRYVQKAGMKWSKGRKDRKRTRGRVRERRPRLDGGRALTLPEVAVIASVHTSGLVDVGSVGRVRVDVVLVDGRSGVRLVDTGRVVDEGTTRANGRRSSVRVVVLGRGHGGDGSEVLLAGSALSAGAGEADGDSRPQLAAGGGNDEPDLRRDTNVSVGEAETVDSVAGDNEESEVELSRGSESVLAHIVSRKGAVTHTEGNDRYNEGEEGEEGTENTENEVGTEGEEERDEGDTGRDRGQDEGVGKVAENGLGRDVLLSRKLRDEVARVSELGAGAHR